MTERIVSGINFIIKQIINITNIFGESIMAQTFSINQMAWGKAQKFINKPEFYGVTITKSSTGATVIDAGVNTPGGFQAGKLLTELCLGCAGKVQLGFKTYEELTFPSITVTSDHPAIAMLG